MFATLHKIGLVVITFACLSLFTATAHAHEIRPAIVDLFIAEEGTYKLTIRLNLEAIIANIGPQHDDTSESENAQMYDRLRSLSSQELTARFNEYSQTFLSGISLSSDQGKLNPLVSNIDIPGTGDIDLARDSTITLSGTLPANTEYLTWGWQQSFGASALRISTSEQEDAYSAYLLPGKTSDRIPLQGAETQSVWEVFANYLVIGFEHIIPKGLDHILFVVGLFLLSLRLAPLLWQITSFTIAHSITLALGILGYANISPAIVEPLIALSIVYVCVENIISDKLHKWRPVVIFSFGLLHGLGFASVLTDIGLSTGHFISGLIAFNIGIEIGQLAVIAICYFSVAFWLGHKVWYRQVITIPASGLIAIIGAYWFIERAFL